MGLTMSDRWVSLDLSTTCSGVAFWAGPRLVSTTTIKKSRTEIDAWREALTDCKALVYEDGLMHRPQVAKALSEHRGMVLAVWKIVANGPMRAVNVQAWRKVARLTWGLPFPAHSAGCKELAVWLVRKQWGIEVGADEADAVLVGHWAVKTRAIESARTEAA